MTYFADLTPCTYFGSSDPRLLAIGWLDVAHPIPTGRVERARFEALGQLLVSPWQPVFLAGPHRCPWCVFTGGPGSVAIDRVTSVTVGVANVFVPADDAVYVAPSLVVHYIDAHGYAPPEAFWRAVETCPEMRSMPYLRAIRAHGIHQLGRS